MFLEDWPSAVKGFAVIPERDPRPFEDRALSFFVPEPAPLLPAEPFLSKRSEFFFVVMLEFVIVRDGYSKVVLHKACS